METEVSAGNTCDSFSFTNLGLVRVGKGDWCQRFPGEGGFSAVMLQLWVNFLQVFFHLGIRGSNGERLESLEGARGVGSFITSDDEVGWGWGWDWVKVLGRSVTGFENWDVGGKATEGFELCWIWERRGRGSWQRDLRKYVKWWDEWLCYRVLHENKGSTEDQQKDAVVKVKDFDSRVWSSVFPEGTSRKDQILLYCEARNNTICNRLSMENVTLPPCPTDR